MSPNQRSKALLESEGWLVDVVERRLAPTVTKDLFTIIDLVAIKDGATMGVQCTSDSNVAARRKKILASAEYPRVLAAGWSLEIHGWAVSHGKARVRRVNMQSLEVAA